MPVPCGGTHIASPGEIGEFAIRKTSNKGDKLKVYYILQN